MLSLMPLKVSRFSFYLVTLNCRHSSDLISMHEVMPLTLVSPAPGHGSCLSSPQFHHAGLGRSTLLLCLEHLPAMLCCALLRRTHACCLAAVQPWPRLEHGVPAPAGWQITVGAGQISLAYAFMEWERGCDTLLSMREVPVRGWRSARRRVQALLHGTDCVRGSIGFCDRDQMDPSLKLLPPFSQGHRISDWGFVL